MSVQQEGSVLKSRAEGGSIEHERLDQTANAQDKQPMQTSWQ